MYDYMNKELFYTHFTVEEDSLTFFLEYFKTRDKTLLSTIWGENSVQKHIFIFCEELYRYLSQNQTPDQEEFFKEISIILKDSVTIKLFFSYYKTLYNHYLAFNEKTFNQNCHSYKDSNFGIHYFKNVSSIELREIHNPKNLNFYIVLDGLIKYGNYLLGSRDILYSNISSLERKFDIITSDCSVIVFILKKEFLNKIDVQLIGEKLGTFKLYTFKILEPILKCEHISSKNYLKLFQIAIYLNERIYYSKITPFDVQYFNYKRIITKTIEKNIHLSEKEIAENLLVELNVSISKLYKIFMNLFFTTPNKYIEGVKIINSYYLLANTNDKIEDIGEEVGYSHKAFKEKFFIKTGYFPSIFRTLTKENDL